MKLLGELCSRLSRSSQTPFICRHMLLQLQQEHTLKKSGFLYPKCFPVAVFTAGTRNTVPLQLSAFTSHLGPFSSSFSCLADSLSAANTNLSLAVLSFPALVLRTLGIRGVDHGCEHGANQPLTPQPLPASDRVDIRFGGKLASRVACPEMSLFIWVCFEKAEAV